MRLTYKLRPAGWANLEVIVHGHRFLFEVSYMSHSLADITRASLDVLRGKDQVRFPLIEEPGHHCWVLTRQDDTLVLSVYFIGDGMFSTDAFNRGVRTSPPEQDALKVFTAVTTPREFASDVLAMLDDLRARTAPEVFKKTRNEPVPEELYEQLVQALSQRADIRIGP